MVDDMWTSLSAPLSLSQVAILTTSVISSILRTKVYQGGLFLVVNGRRLNALACRRDRLSSGWPFRQAP